ncbi:MAG TPA: hypothetical protein VHQ93_11025 [Chitinophagaceae bacterium]|nr:hypothetical protein [Chitinophagaceae bacterium]
MNNHKLNGIWKGFYKYGNMYPETYQKIAEPFTVEIEFDGVNFKGICKDRFSEKYFSSPASIEGTFVPNLISFIKKYPALLTIDDNLQTIVIPEKPSHEIHYTGFFYKGLFSRSIRFEGEWVMTDFILTENGKREYFNCTGTWNMKK